MRPAAGAMGATEGTATTWQPAASAAATPVAVSSIDRAARRVSAEPRGGEQIRVGVRLGAGHLVARDGEREVLGAQRAEDPVDDAPVRGGDQGGGDLVRGQLGQEPAGARHQRHARPMRSSNGC